MNLCPGLFGEIQIVTFGGVLGVVRASGHALGAEDAAGAIGSYTTEVGVGHRLTRLTEEHPPHRLGGMCLRRPGRRRPTSRPRLMASISDSWRPRASVWPDRNTVLIRPSSP